MTTWRRLYVAWPVLLFLATLVAAGVYDPTQAEAPLPFSFAAARFAALLSWPMAVAIVPMAAGFTVARRAWARDGSFSLTDKMATVWFLMCATWFHLGCDVLSGLFQVMPDVTDVYRAMNAALWQPMHHPARIVLDVVYWFELFVQMPLAWLTFGLYVTRSPARPAVECLLCGLHITGTVAYYVPDLILGQTTHWVLTNADRAMASLWIWVPAALAIRAARAQRGSSAT